MEKLRTYTVASIDEKVGKPLLNKADFVELRNLLCSRVSLFNGRRGGEPARTKIEQFLNRDKCVRKDDFDKLSEEDRLFVNQNSIMVLVGKGNKLVTCIMPPECIKGIEIFCDETNRNLAGILPENQYIFASTNRFTMCHIDGWKATSAVCAQAGITIAQINVTNQRGRLSTIYAGQELPPQERELFYQHLGHTKEVNKEHINVLSLCLH